MNKSVQIPEEYTDFQKSYRNYCTPEVLRITREFHRRTEYHISREIPVSMATAIPYSALEAAEWSETRFYPRTDAEIPIPRQSPGACSRQRSAQMFAGNPIPDNDLYQILDTGFLVHAHNGVPHRPYASAGALFPVEIFMAITKVFQNSELRPGLYHVLCRSRALMPFWIPSSPADIAHVFTPADWGAPPVSLVYVINLSKAVLKYNYRGYRHAMMEVGVLYQQMDTILCKYDLKSRCWSGFSDAVLGKALGLNRDEFFPALVQCVGAER